MYCTFLHVGNGPTNNRMTQDKDLLQDSQANKATDVGPIETLVMTSLMGPDTRPTEDLSFTCVMSQPMRLMMPDQWKTSASPV
jgi:hypothetical protein